MLAGEVYFTYNSPMEKEQEQLVRQAKMLLDRLERLSADSIWAHRASGLRGSLIKKLAALDRGRFDISEIRELVRQGYFILYQAAREIPERE